MQDHFSMTRADTPTLTTTSDNKCKERSKFGICLTAIRIKRPDNWKMWVFNLRNKRIPCTVMSIMMSRWFRMNKLKLILAPTRSSANHHTPNNTFPNSCLQTRINQDFNNRTGTSTMLTTTFIKNHPKLLTCPIRSQRETSNFPRMSHLSTSAILSSQNYRRKRLSKNFFSKKKQILRHMPRHQDKPMNNII